MPNRTAHDLGVADLVLSHFSLPRFLPIDERIALAGGAGFSGIGLYLIQYGRMLAEGESVARLHDLLDEHDVLLAEIEVVRGWGQRGAPYDECRRMEQIAFAMADEFQCRYMQAIGPVEGTLSDAASAFGALCDRAADHNLVVGLEFLPFTNVRTAAEALDIVERAGRENGGLCVDIWHHERGARDLSMIRSIPGDRVHGIQMNDGTIASAMPDDYVQDCLRHRVAPGKGEFDVAAIVGILRDELDVSVPWSLEVPNEAAFLGDLATHVQECAQGMRAYL